MNRSRQGMLNRLARFYCQTQKLNDHLASRLGSVEEGSTEEENISWLVRGEEDRARVESYFFKLVYAISPEFRTENSALYGRVIPPDPTERERVWNDVKEKITKYVSQKGMDFDTLTSEFMSLYHRLLFGVEIIDKRTRDTLIQEGKMRLIHGDFGPHNVMLYMESKGGKSPGRQKGKIFDLNEMHFGPPQKDVSSALFNLYCDTGESYVPSLVINDLWKRVSGIREAYPNPLDFLIGCMATRLLQDIRISASNSDYSDYEIKRFTKDHPDFAQLGQEEKRNRFREERIADIQDMIPFYMFGPGMNKVFFDATPDRREALRDILYLVRNFLHRTYVDSVAQQSYRGIDMDELTKRVVNGE